MSNKKNRFWAELGILAFGYLAEKKIKELKEEENDDLKRSALEIAHAFSKDMQENPDNYYDLGEELSNRYQKWKNENDD